MPRNSSGVYQLPAGNPVVTGTIIESDWANVTMTDLAQAMTNSLDRLGSSTMAAPMLLTDGIVSAPGLAFGAESSTGLYRESAHMIGIAIAGVEVGRWTSAGLSVLSGLSVTGGTTFTGDTTFTGNAIVNGYVQTVGGVRAVAPTGAASLNLDAIPTSGTDVSVITLFGQTKTTGAVALNFCRGDGTGTIDHALTGGATGLKVQLARNGGRTIVGGTTDDGTNPFQVVGAARAARWLSDNDSPSGPGFSWQNSLGVGLYLPAVGILGFCTGATEKMRILQNPDPTVLIGIGAAQLSTANRAVLEINGTTQAVLGLDVGGVSQANLLATTSAVYLGHGSGPVLFQPGGTEKVRITPSADAQLLVGITAPTGGQSGRGLVEINGSGTSGLQFDVAGASSGGILSTTSALWFTSTAGALIFQSANAEKARITSQPQAELMIGQTSSSSSAAGRGLIALNGSTDSALFLSNAGTTRGYLWGNSNGMTLDVEGGLAIMFTRGGTEVFRADTDGTLKYGGFEVGFRAIPVSAQTAAYTVAVTDKGKCVRADAGCTQITLAAWNAGDVVTFANNSGGAITIATGGITLRWGTGSGMLAGNRTVAANAIVTIFFYGGSLAKITGEGIS